MIGSQEIARINREAKYLFSIAGVDGLEAARAKEEAWKKARLTKLTASNANRLTAGIDETPRDRARIYLNSLLVKDLAELAKEEYPDQPVSKKIKKEEYIDWLLPKVEKWDQFGADTLPSGAISYIEELLIEAETEEQFSDFESYDMKEGTRRQPETVACFEEVKGLKLRNTCEDEIFREAKGGKLKGKVGATPDGDLEEDGLTFGFEGKSPKKETHRRYKRGKLEGQTPAQEPLTKENLKEIEPGYWWQIIQGLLVTGWDGWYFMSFHPAYKGEARYVILKILRSDVLEDINKLKKRLEMAVERIEQELANKQS